MRRLVYSLSIIIVSLIGCQKTTEDNAGTAVIPEGFSAIFFAINDTTITTNDPDQFEKLETKITGINLEGDNFWEGHQKFFMHAWGAITSEKEGRYYFKVAVNGKVELRLNNKELFNNKKVSVNYTDTTSMYMEKGSNLIEISYYDGGLDPKLVLMWSEDGINYETIPESRYVRADVSVEPGTGGVEDTTESLLNALTEKEIDEGWRLLFDGETTNGWHTFNKPGQIGSKWKVIDNALTFEGRDRFTYLLEGKMMEKGETDKVGDGGEDIVSDETFENFELKLEWKISYGGNCGIFYTVLEDEKYDENWKTSPEMQVLHNEVHKDGIIYKHRAGDLYDLIAAKPQTTKPQGEWNRVKIIKNQGKVEHWQNGVKVLEYDLSSEEWKNLIAKSKFSDKEDFATPGPRHIGFQDHDNEAAFRNIKIREL